MYVYHTVYGLFCTSPREFVLWKFSFVLPLVPRFLSTCCYTYTMYIETTTATYIMYYNYTDCSYTCICMSVYTTVLHTCYIHNVLQLYRLQLHASVCQYIQQCYIHATYINNAYMYIAVTSTRIRGKNSDKLHQKHLHQNKRATGTSIIQWLHIEQEYVSFLYTM